MLLRLASSFLMRRVAARTLSVGTLTGGNFHCQTGKPPQRQPRHRWLVWAGLMPCTDSAGGPEPAPGTQGWPVRDLLQGAQRRAPAAARRSALALTQAGCRGLGFMAVANRRRRWGPQDMIFQFCHVEWSSLRGLFSDFCSDPPKLRDRSSTAYGPPPRRRFFSLRPL